MPFGPFVTLLAVTLCTPAPAPLPRTPRAARVEATRRAPVLPADDLYSLRARRRLASYLRLRLLEMRKAGLERAAGVIEHRLPVDALFGQSQSPARAP
jgi:hypothetical protein